LESRVFWEWKGVVYKQFHVSLALGFLAVQLAGCNGNAAKDNAPPGKKDNAANTDMREVWLHVDGMSKRLNIY
jgi:hypothetical protein